MAELHRLPELNASEKLTRKPMTLIDHAKSAGFHSPVFIGRNPRGEIVFDCEEAMSCEAMLYLLEGAKLSLMGAIK